MNESGVVLLGAVASALFSAYFIGSFAFVAYVLRKYDALKDELRVHGNRIDRMSSLENLVKGRGKKSFDPEVASVDGD